MFQKYFLSQKQIPSQNHFLSQEIWFVHQKCFFRIILLPSKKIKSKKLFAKLSFFSLFFQVRSFRRKRKRFDRHVICHQTWCQSDGQGPQGGSGPFWVMLGLLGPIQARSPAPGAIPTTDGDRRGVEAPKGFPLDCLTQGYPPTKFGVLHRVLGYYTGY